MIPFKKLNLADKDLIQRFTKQSGRRTADMLFANMYGWRHITNIHYAIVEGMLVLRYEMKGSFTYSLPIGNGNLRFVLMQMLEDAQTMRFKCRIFGIPENCKADVESAMPGHFDFVSDEASSDYMYKRESLATLEGKKLQAKRNHVNKFFKLYPEAKYMELTEELVPKCKDLEKKWNAEQMEENTYISRKDEYNYTTCLLDNFRSLGLKGGVVMIGDEVAAFTLGGYINDETFDVCVEKADSSYEGVYAVIAQAFAASLPDTCVYVNREEDMGLEGLRQAKRSFAPEEMLVKWVAVPRLAYGQSIFYNNEDMVPSMS